MKNPGIIFLLIVSLLCPQWAGAQASVSSTTGLRRGVAIVMFAGLAGAVLGASTLSFYGEPQEHISNIWTGLAIGALVGGGYVISQGQKPAMSLEQQWPTNPYQVAKTKRPLVQYQFDF